MALKARVRINYISVLLQHRSIDNTKQDQLATSDCRYIKLDPHVSISTPPTYLISFWYQDSLIQGVQRPGGDELAQVFFLKTIFVPEAEKAMSMSLLVASFRIIWFPDAGDPGVSNTPIPAPALVGVAADPRVCPLMVLCSTWVSMAPKTTIPEENPKAVAQFGLDGPISL